MLKKLTHRIGSALREADRRLAAGEPPPLWFAASGAAFGGLLAGFLLGFGYVTAGLALAVPAAALLGKPEGAGLAWLMAVAWLLLTARDGQEKRPDRGFAVESLEALGLLAGLAAGVFTTWRMVNSALIQFGLEGVAGLARAAMAYFGLGS